MNEHVIAWLFATILLILLAASGTTHWLIARRCATPTLTNLRARVHAWWLMSYASNLATVGWVTPIRSAISCWVSPRSPLS